MVETGLACPGPREADVATRIKFVTDRITSGQADDTAADQ